jgi:hypothetical protein
LRQYIAGTIKATNVATTPPKGEAMGIGVPDLELLLSLRQQGCIADPGAVIEVGAQQLTNSMLQSPELVARLGRSFGVKTEYALPKPLPSMRGEGNADLLDANAPLARDFWRWLGFAYASIDIDGSPGSIPLDLNYDDVPADAIGKYHLVTNYGTTEHVANQLNAFKVIHDLTAVGGVMVHTVPAQGMPNHGLINYNMKFFWMLARSNNYKWLYAGYGGTSESYAIPENILDDVKSFNPSIVDNARAWRVSDAGISVAVQKQSDIEFVAPLDVNTGSRPANEALSRRYWTVYRPEELRRPVVASPVRRWVGRAWRRVAGAVR